MAAGASVVLMIWGGEQQRVDVQYASDIVVFAGLRMRVSQIAVIVVLFSALALTHVFFRYSRFGIAMRAVAADALRETAVAHERNREIAARTQAKSRASGKRGRVETRTS